MRYRIRSQIWDPVKTTYTTSAGRRPVSSTLRYKAQIASPSALPTPEQALP